MPGNTIVVNGTLEYYVSDEKMGGLLKYLSENAYHDQAEGQVPGAEAMPPSME
jgi:hypothetical protein